VSRAIGTSRVIGAMRDALLAPERTAHAASADPAAGAPSMPAGTATAGADALPPDVFLIGCADGADAGATTASAAAMGFKAWNLLRMARLGLSVPPAFVIGTAYCAQPAAAAGTLDPQVWHGALAALEHATGQALGDVRHPLLLSVRSGAAVSMPGMMETLLDVGLCDATVPGLLRRTGNPRLVCDAYRRLVATYGEVVAGLPATLFEDAAAALFGARDERDLDFAELRTLTRRFLALYAGAAGHAFPQRPVDQLAGAIAAVFASWQSDKARAYRRMNALSDAAGTAVTVQSMVFGNAGGRSGAGVGFTRDPATGEPALWVDFLFDAQGEDVVSGRRSANGHDELAAVVPQVWHELGEAAARIERAFADMQDFEFTVQDGRLFMLQARAGKRSPRAAVRIALDMLDQGLITPALAIERTAGLDRQALGRSRVVARPGEPLVPLGHAASASIVVASGEIALDQARAQARHAAGVPVILVRRDAETSDIGALECAQGLLTQRGARTSHAAVVARQLGKVCLVGCTAMQLDETGRTLQIGATTLREGDLLTLDGNDGAVYAGAMHTAVEPLLALQARLKHLRATQGKVTKTRENKKHTKALAS